MQDPRLLTEAEDRFAPGTNLKGAVGGASWCFLLPGLDLHRIVCLGSPSTASLATLAGLADEVAVCAGAPELRRLRRGQRDGVPPNVSLLTTDRRGIAPLPDGGADLVFVPRMPFLRPSGRSERLEEAKRLLTPEGVVYLEGRFLGPIGSGTVLWLAPAAGEVRIAAPLADRLTTAFLERRFLGRSAFRRQLLRRPRRVLARHSAVGRILGRRGALVSSSGNGAGLPRYVRSVAEAEGVDLGDRRWALAAPGEYPSQKVLLFLFGPGEETPDAIVKLTREAEQNFRLENEWRALVELRERGIGAEGTVPRPLFFGRHAGRALLGETAVNGMPFQERTQATADCRYARAVVDWLLELGEATAERPTEKAAGALARMPALFENFARTYRLPGEQEDFLAGHVATLTQGALDVPAVFQHGDPGPWNVLITPDGRPAFLDWEAADPRGMPLWDLFHFLRSYGFSCSRAAGKHGRLQSFAEHYLDDSAFNRVLVETARRFCADVDLAPAFVEPLFYSCWMHRAVKEAATLPHDQLAEGRYVNILRLALERRNSPGLRRLFSIGADA